MMSIDRPATEQARSRHAAVCYPHACVPISSQPACCPRACLPAASATLDSAVHHTHVSSHAVGVVALVAQGQMIAAALERQAAVVIVRCCRGGGGAVELREVARVAVHGISLPCRMHWSSVGKVWVVGCASVDGTAAVAAGYIHQSGITRLCCVGGLYRRH